MSAKVGDFVLPGDTIKDITPVKNITMLGPGLRTSTEPNSLLATCAGTLSFKPPNYYWIESSPKRYQPNKGDLVLGIVAKKAGDTLKIDIGSSEHASLSTFAFEGATKKQKPDLQVGDAVYARVLSSHREMEPELVCVDKYFKAGKLGPLSVDGFVINISLNLVNRLLDVENVLLETLGRKFPYEVAIGMNGKMWINAKNTRDVFKLVNVFVAAEHQSDKEILRLCRQY